MQVLDKTDYDKNRRKFHLAWEDIIVVEYMIRKEVVEDLKEIIGYGGPRVMMDDYGCHVIPGMPLTHEALREIFIGALELREKRTVLQSTVRADAIELAKEAQALMEKGAQTHIQK
ncbi:uncharacterized protein Pyn_14540 [Prunus yedoensis var. nudiflora]|uniref:Uncharacterized protein n=1 Tax=Prunus yedoensis var. nudiflora TaxID=2094558 RepID=A0A314Y2F6_PRUYE|nr:uncharacterized protein Pyn_14540 [Prunus yedoensis var. nudiflora]